MKGCYTIMNSVADATKSTKKRINYNFIGKYIPKTARNDLFDYYGKLLPQKRLDLSSIKRV